MPVTYRIDAERRRIETVCTGAVTLAEVLAHFDELDRDPGRPPSPDVLILLGGLALPQTAELRTVADRLGWKPGFSFRDCAVVAESEALFGIGKMFAAHAGGHFRAIAVFRDRDEAEAWLTEPRGR